MFDCQGKDSNSLADFFKKQDDHKTNSRTHQENEIFEPFASKLPQHKQAREREDKVTEKEEILFSSSIYF